MYLSTVNHQLILLDREFEGYKKSTTEEQEQNETLTMQLNWSQVDCATSKKLISQKQAQQEAMQAHYSACLRTLKETERSLARLSKVARGQKQSQYLCTFSFPLQPFHFPIPFLNDCRKPPPTRLKWTIRGGSWRKRVPCVCGLKTRSWLTCSRSSPTTGLPNTPKGSPAR